MRPLAAATLVGLLVSSLSASAPDGDDLSGKEKIGELQLAQPAAVVKKLLGAPTKKGKINEQEADGAFVQRWEYPAQGIALEMAAATRKGAQKVAAIEVKAPCALKTARGIAVGSTSAEVARAYGRYRNADDSTDDRFVAGSIYGGVVFGIKDGKVESIFVGAAAE